MTARTFMDLISSPDDSFRSLIEPWALLEGGTAVIGGEAGIGKSFFALELIRALASATPPFASRTLHVPRPCTVLYLEQELTEPGLRKRIIPMFRDDQEAASRVWYVSAEPAMRLDTAQGVRLLTSLAGSIHPDVIVFDPIGRFHLLSEDDASTVQRIFMVVDEVKKAAGEHAAAIIVHHARKPPVDPAGADHDPLSPYNMRGSSKWYDVPDTRIMLARDRSGYLRARWKMRHAETIHQRIELRISDEEISLKEVDPRNQRPATFSYSAPFPCPSQ